MKGPLNAWADQRVALIDQRLRHEASYTWRGSFFSLGTGVPQAVHRNVQRQAQGST